MLAEIANDLNIKIFRGDENDVLFRYYKASLITDCNFIVRITGDCPLIDPSIISETIKELFSQNVDLSKQLFPSIISDELDIKFFSKGFI